MVDWAGIGILAGLYAADQGSKIGREYISADLQKALQANAARLNYEYSIKSARNLPTANRFGLESAGYNPMLAVQNSTSGANSSWTSAGSTTSHSNDNSLSNAFSNAQDVQRLKNETAQSESTVEANIATAEKANAEKSEILERLPFVSDKEKASIQKLQAETATFEAQIENMKKRLELDQQLGFMGINVQQSANANQAERNRILEKSMPSGRSQSFANYTGGVRNVMSGIGDIIHGRNDYENYYEERQVINGPKGRSQEKVTSRRSGKRKKK